MEIQSDLLVIGKRIIEKEANALSHFMGSLDESFVKAATTIFKCDGTVLLTGIGKSGLVARKWSSTFSSTGTPSYFINPAEAPHGDLGIIQKKDILIALSNSGDTRELLFVLRHANECGIPIIGVTSNPKSLLAEQSKIVLSVYLSEEACPLGLAPMTSTTLMMALGDALASTLIQMRGFTESDFARLHPGGSLGRRLWLRVGDLMHKGEKIPLVNPDSPFDRVLIEMTQKCLGLAIVIENEKVLGIVTDGDLRRFFQKNHDVSIVVAKLLMTKDPKTILESALASEALELMKTNSIQQLLVLDSHQKLKGVIHIHDLLRASL